VKRRGFFSFLKDNIRDFGVDFVGIQETMLKVFSNSFLRWLSYYGNFKWHWLQSRGKSGGILSGIKEYRFDVLNFSMGVFHLREVILKKI
jgi:hypothetical protein